jgi:CubicO group peptidase (beta-lactamase class C family)
MGKTRLAGLALALGALSLAGCAKHSGAPAAQAQAQTPYDPYVGKTFPLTPAVIAARWQLLNPDVESFMFRDMDRVFESRGVPRSGAVWDLPRASGFKMPKEVVDGQTYDYPQYAERTYTNAFLVIRHGKVVFEDYRNRSVPTTRFLSMSMAKTITSMLVGIALGEHKIASLDDPAEKYVPELKGSGFEGVTIRQILQMRSGIDYEERYDFGKNPSFAAKLHEQAIILNKMRFAAGALETKRKEAPGSRFNYSTLNTMLLGWILENATGEKLEDYTREKLWAPLGAEADAYWIADGPPGVGRALNGMGFNATLRDFGRFGLMMLHQGKAGDTQVVPADWIKQATTMLPTGQSDRTGYGYQIWQVDDEPGAYAAVGLAGQFIYVSPATDTVIVKLSYLPMAAPPSVQAEAIGYFKAIAHTPDS